MDWNGICEIALTYGEIISCPKCKLKVKEWRRKGEWTNIHIGNLLPNIIFFQDINNPLSEMKVSVINKDAKLKPNILLIINILLAINGLRYKLKNKLIPIIY